jgi:hypothetical protein
MRMNKIICAFVGFALVISAALAVELTGTSAVNVTSDTAAEAKTKAFNTARRDVILRELRNYANTEQLAAALNESTNEELMNIISSSSINAEKSSATTYSANISFVIDGDAAKLWMEKYSVQNWLPSSTAPVPVENMVSFSVALLQPIADWADLNAIARDAGVDLAVTKIVGNTVNFALNRKDTEKLVGALRLNGWRAVPAVDGFIIRR